MNSSARCWVAPLTALCALLLAGCGSSAAGSSTSSSTTTPASVSTPARPDPTTKPTASSTTADTASMGAPSFVLHGTTQEVDKVKVEGRFGSPLRPSESDVDQTALGE